MDSAIVAWARAARVIWADALADLDGDGDLDLVSIAYDDFTKVHVWRNDSGSTASGTVAAKTSPKTAPRVQPSPRVAPPANVAPKTTPREKPSPPVTAPADVAPKSAPRSAQGIVAHWKLDERSGNRAADASGHAHHGTLAGATWTAGRRDGALAFDGTNDRVECGTWDVAGSAITLAAWIKPAAGFVDNDARIISKAVGNQEQDHWWMLSTSSVDGERRLRVRLKAGGSTTTLIARSGRLALDTWTHVAATYDGASLRLFVNGIETGSVPKTGTLDTGTSAAVWVGANPLTGYAPFRGLIDDVRIYNAALATGDITAIMDDRPVKDASR